MADDAFAAAKPFEIKIVGRAAVTSAVVNDETTEDVTENEVTVDLIIESAQPIGDLSAVDTDDTTDGDQGINVKVTAIDRNGFVIAPTDAITVTDLPKVAADAAAADARAFYAMRTAKKRQLRVVITQQADADDATKGAIARVVIEIPVIGTTDSYCSGSRWNRYRSKYE